MGHTLGKKNVMRTPEEKEKLVLEYLNSNIGIMIFALDHDINRGLFRRWVNKYQKFGIDGLKSQTGKHSGPNKGRPKKGDENEELKRQLAKKDLIIERLKKGYTVKGVGAKKEYVTTFDKNMK